MLPVQIPSSPPITTRITSVLMEFNPCELISLCVAQIKFTHKTWGPCLATAGAFKSPITYKESLQQSKPLFWGGGLQDSPQICGNKQSEGLFRSLRDTIFLSSSNVGKGASTFYNLEGSLHTVCGGGDGISCYPYAGTQLLQFTIGV